MGATINIFESTISRNAALSPSIIVDNIDSAISWIFCGGDPYGQTFIPGANAISGFSFRVRFEAGTATDIVVPGRIRKDGPLGDVLASTTTTIPAGTAGTISYILNFELDQPLGVDPAATYAIEMDIPGAVFNPYRSDAPSPVPGRQVYNCSTTLFDLEFDFQVRGGDGRDGGGIYSAGEVNLQNSTVSGNVGDGAFASAPNNVVSAGFSTVVNNSGNGLTAETGIGSPGGVIAFGGSILAGNFGSDCFRDDLGALSVSVDFNLIGDISGCDFFVPQTI